MPAEKIFENKVKKYLKEKGVWYVKFFANAFTKTGVPDILAVANGRFLGLEIKSEIGKPSPLQLRNIEQINNCGGYAIVLSPHNFEDFKKDLEEILSA